MPAETAEDGPVDGQIYIAGPAQRKAGRRRAKPRKRYRLSCERLWARVAEWLGRGWSPLPAGARVGVTHDNGTEFARHTRLRDEPGMDTYFADPYSSRRRGSNENGNGMIRRHPPKRSEIRMDMAGELREIVDEADNRPMRVLDYRTPAEAFAGELLELQDQQGCCTSK